MVWLKKTWIFFNSGFIFLGSCSPQHSDPIIPRVALCIFPTQHPSRGKHLGGDNVPASLPSFLPNPLASQILLPVGKSAGRDAGRVLCGVLPESAHRSAPSRSTRRAFISEYPLWGCLPALFPPGTGYISWEAGRARKVIPEQAPEGAAGRTEGGVAWCVGIFVFAASPLFPATLLKRCRPLLPSHPRAKCSQEWKKPQILPNKAGLMHFFRATEAAVAPCERGSPPPVPP